MDELAPRPVLPSFTYIPGAHDLPPGSTALPWAPERTYLVGEFAREQGIRVPERLVSSAKSWLSHSGVDRTAPILPWGADEGIERISPVEASRRYLQHIAESWNARMALGSNEIRFEDQLIVLTVPASFDEVARELTVSAAEAAGIHNAILLEEPMAAFYAWLSRHEHDWQEEISDGQLILVCDIGGGTTDFSVVAVRSDGEGLKLDRLAVGDHLLLGGDNMDLTLGRHVETRLMGQPGKLDAARWHQVVFRCRQAKEQLLGTHSSSAPDTPSSVDITVVSGGSNLIAGTLTTTLTEGEVHDLILDGFFPKIDYGGSASTVTRTGLTELGLPYIQNPAITQHLATFWRRYEPLLQEETGREQIYPDFILFNGGTLAPAVLQQRLVDVVADWFQSRAGSSWQPAQLTNQHPELAVAIGGAYYGLVRLGEGVRIGSGSPRAYYVEVASSIDNKSDRTDRSRTGVCLIPRGAQEGLDIRLQAPTFEALTNQPVSFQIFTSTDRIGDQPGDIVTLSPESVSMLPSITSVLRYGRRGTATRIPVRLAVRLNETGTLELWCESIQTEHRWLLQFDVRDTGAKDEEIEDVGIPTADGQYAGIDRQSVFNAQDIIRHTFSEAGASKNFPPEQLRKKLEAELNLPKEEWPAPVIRALADALLEQANYRDTTFQHEAYWLNLLGYCQRPGFGDAADELRMKTIWGIYLKGLSFPQKVQGRSEWWVFWRRVAAGFNAGKQLQIYEQILPSLQSNRSDKQAGGKNSSGKSGRKKSSKGGRIHLGAAEELEVWMMLANFERLPTPVKTELGRLLLAKVREGQPQAKELWALSRFGARETAYGPLDRVIPAGEAEGWLEVLLQMDLAASSGAAHTLVHIAQYTGDRTRDVSSAMRSRVATWLTPLANAAHFHDLLDNAESNRSNEEEAWIFGEALPLGLALHSGEEKQ